VTPCPAPLSPAARLDYWTGDLPPEVERETEEHLMACGECSAQVERLGQLALAVRGLTRSGGVPLCLTSALLERIERDGVRVRHHRVDPGGVVACTVGPEDDLVAMRLTGDFRPDERVDLLFEEAPSGLAARREDVPVDRARGEVLFVEPGDVLRPLPAAVAVIHLYGISETGTREIGQYTLHHTPWPGR